ncbi:MAG: polysaccharide deacetylase family protein [Fimbriimonadaceae bacterium]
MSTLLGLLFAYQLHVAPTVGDRLAPFTLLSAKGGEFSWSPGRATIVSFCAFWCDTWKRQLPEVSKAATALRGLPVDFLTISVDGRWTEQGRNAAVGRNLSDPGMRWTNRIGIDRVPYTLIVDAGGIVRWAISGEVAAATITHEARHALRSKAHGGTVYLTFDDFPAAVENDDLLDVLRKANASATIFCICSKAARYAAVMRRAVDEGNRLEIHAWVHGEPVTDLTKCARTIEQFGPPPDFFRPSGKESIYNLDRSKLSFTVVNPYDYTRPGAAEIIRRVTHEAVDGAVIQLHAGVQDTIDALPAIIRNLRDRGYTLSLLTPPPSGSRAGR